MLQVLAKGPAKGRLNSAATDRMWALLTARLALFLPLAQPVTAI